MLGGTSSARIPPSPDGLHRTGPHGSVRPMTLASRITRTPRAFAPDLGRDVLSRLPSFAPEVEALIEGAAGSSPYLKDLVERESEWLEEALADPEAAGSDVLEGLTDVAPDELNRALRQAKARIALLTGLMDLGGVWPLETVTGALTDLADTACRLALRAEIAKAIRAGKLPGQGEEALDDAGGMVVMAMGKMGARELNYSSDIDLICLFDESRYGRDDYLDARAALIKATRAFTTRLSDRTADGYVFRTDLRLRPDPSVTPVCVAMEAAEQYYESLGRTWERAAYIKARPAAGDTEAGERFITALRPFIWRRHLDFAAIQDAHDMRLRIRETKGTGGPLSVPGHDLKLGRGGIREIEFFTQTRQLIAGGRDDSLRVRGTVEGLAALADSGWVTPETAEKLTAHYRAHREIEHRIQMVHDSQTHTLPAGQEEFARVACLAGLDPEELKSGLARRLAEVHELTEGFFAPGMPAAPRDPEVDFDTGICRRWPSYPALRSQRAREIFERLRPELLRRLARAAKPEEALLALDGFLSKLPAGVQLFALFEANPQLIDLLIDIVGVSPALAGHLSRNAGVFDAVIGGDFFADWPGAEALTADLNDHLAPEADYESRLDAARRWAKEWHFRIGVHHLRGLVDAATAGQQYADLADAVVTALLPVVTSNFAKRHGPPPGRGAAVLGMGSLGSQRLTASSDLDLIVIYDPDGVENSEGPRPLAARTYYARLTQALITALSAPTAEGRLYEVDMRLRPSGNQGPVATSWSSFREYQTTDAWIWEHLALTRARVVASGSDGLARDIETFRQSLLGRTAGASEVLEAVADMRTRIAEAKAPGGVLDAKIGAGRLQDIELLAQAGALIAGEPVRGVEGGIAAAVDSGWLGGKEARSLTQAARLMWSVIAAMRLLSATPIEVESLGEGAGEFLCRATGMASIEDLQIALESAYAESDATISAALQPETRP